jgi:hypothetical protein
MSNEDIFYLRRLILKNNTIKCIIAQKFPYLFMNIPRDRFNYIA